MIQSRIFQIVLSMVDFFHPTLVVWFPEAVYSRFYPDALPICKFHSITECVELKGWYRQPRHCYGSHRIHALMFKTYSCKIWEADTSIHPFHFGGCDKKVIDQMHDYIQTKWTDNGFFLSRKGGISHLKVMQKFRSALNQGMSVCCMWLLPEDFAWGVQTATPAARKKVAIIFG